MRRPQNNNNTIRNPCAREKGPPEAVLINTIYGGAQAELYGGGADDLERDHRVVRFILIFYVWLARTTQDLAKDIRE